MRVLRLRNPRRLTSQVALLKGVAYIFPKLINTPSVSNKTLSQKHHKTSLVQNQRGEGEGERMKGNKMVETIFVCWLCTTLTEASIFVVSVVRHLLSTDSP